MNIFVSNINFRATAEDLKELFSPYGTVISTKIIKDRETGKSRGFGFVEMEDEHDAITAIKKLNGYEYQERALKVNEARPQER